MLILRPLLVLLIPLAVTLMRGRNAWVWLSLAATVVLLQGLLTIAFFQMSQGQVDSWLVDVLFPTQTNRAYQDTYFVVQDYRTVFALLFPSLVVGLLHLLSRPHPQRETLDLLLFWLWIALSVGSTLIFNVILGTSLNGMPQRYADNPGLLDRAHNLSTLLWLLSYGIALYAASRPALSWWRARKARDAL